MFTSTTGSSPELDKQLDLEARYLHNMSPDMQAEFKLYTGLTIKEALQLCDREGIGFKAEFYDSFIEWLDNYSFEEERKCK